MGKNPDKLYYRKPELSRFMYYLINDIKALQQMLDADLFEKDIQRIGAEQELCLLDKTWRPAPLSMQVLKTIDDPHFTTEHSLYNLEINLDPLAFKNDCLSELEATLKSHLSKLEDVVKNLNGEIILVGILPTIRRQDLRIENLTPLRRYKLLGNIMRKLRGGPFEFRIEGMDELITRHDSIMFEGCNTSFQVHFQVSPDKFVRCYNWALAIAAPVLAAATNSPVLLGKRLWQETRIALFQQSVDTRQNEDELRKKSSRITFGNRWVEKSITEIFQEDIARYRVLIGTDIHEDSLEVLEKGEIPSLEALQIHNSTVYKWIRACYGITGGKPHLRIENRTLPAGPTTTDQVANAAFWLGLMNGLPKKFRDVSDKMDFDDAKLNFLRAAQHGLESHFKWFDGEIIEADRLILQTLLPWAYQGLQKAGINGRDIEHYLNIIVKRVETGRTGSKWILDSFAELQKQNDTYEASVAITAGIVHRQKQGNPVHEWKLAEIEEAGDWINRYWRVDQIMSTDIYSVQEDDSVYFTANLMNWKRLRYIPVEDDRGRLKGLLTARALLDYYSTHLNPGAQPVCIKEIMIKNPITVSPETSSIDALALMRNSGVGCLPVTKDDKLVGMLTEHNFMNLSEFNLQQLIEESQKFAKRQIPAEGGKSKD